MLNLLTYNFGIKNNFEQGGIVSLTRHRLGCFCTHHSLGGVVSDPPLLSRKWMDLERRTRRHSKYLDKTLPNHFRKFKIEVTCQVKVRSKVKIGCFQVADRSDLKRSIFRPKLSICTLNRAGIPYFFGTGGIGIRYLKTGHSVSVFRYFRYFGHSVSVFRYFGIGT